MILCCNPTFNNPVKIPLQLLWYCIEYAKKYTFLSASPMREIDTDPPKPPFPLPRVGHCWRFPVHYAWYCPTTYLLPPSTLYRISVYVLILQHHHHPVSLLLYPLYCLSATFFYLCLNLPESPPSHLLKSLSTIPVILCVYLCYTYQPDSTLTFSSFIISIIMYLCLHHICYPAYIMNIFYCCPHRTTSLTLLPP